MKVLIVDGAASARTLLRLALEAEGVSIGDAADGIGALELLRDGDFDAVVSDLGMPRMDGYLLFREIRGDPRLRDLPVIAYTNTYLSSWGDERLALRSGADLYLSNSAPVAILLGALTDLLQRGPPRHSELSAPGDQDVKQDNYGELEREPEGDRVELKERNATLGGAINGLAENRTLFKNIIASALDAIVTIDDTNCIALFNTAAEIMFGAPAAAMIGQPIQRLLPRHFGDSHAADSGGAMRYPKTEALGAVSGRRIGGEEFPVEASISKAEVAGRQFFTVILRDISRRERAEELLRLANEQLRALTVRNETIREHERTTVAREIHDVLAQELTCLKIDLVWIAKRAARPIDEPTRSLMVTRIGEAITQADSAVTTVQRIATELRPVILDSLGLPAAIEWQVEDFARRTDLRFRVNTPQGGSQLSRDRATAIFRILQESLTNIARHAHASEVDVQLTEASDAATLAVTDNGCGITAADISAMKSIGLVGMRERAQAFGGTLEISGAAGAGTTIRVRVPFDSKR